MVTPSAIDPVEVSAYLWKGVQGTTGWDVGANCGQSLEHLRKSCTTIHAFEPGAEAFAYLSEHFGKVPGIHLHELALSRDTGNVRLAALPEQLATGQLVTPGIKGMEWSVPDWSAVPHRIVAASSADNLARILGVPDVVKVDTEGHELAVLEGAAGLIAGRRTQWIIEFHAPELMVACFGLLTNAGYQVEVIRHPHYPPGSDMWHQHGWLRAAGPLDRLPPG